MLKKTSFLKKNKTFIIYAAKWMSNCEFRVFPIDSGNFEEHTFKNYSKRLQILSLIFKKISLFTILNSLLHSR